jgi:hypothetical protein
MSRFSLPMAALASALLIPAALAAPPYAGADLRAEADAADVGLPLYPGARPLAPHDGEDSPAVNLGIWGGSLGFRVAVIKLRSSAPMADVAAYYRQNLQRRGPMRDCARPAEGDGPDCGKSEVPRGGHLFKAGVEDQEIRTVSLSPQDGGVLIQLVRVAFGRAAAAPR